MRFYHFCRRFRTDIHRRYITRALVTTQTTPCELLKIPPPAEMLQLLRVRGSLRPLGLVFASVGFVLLLDIWTGFTLSLTKDSYSLWYSEFKVDGREVIQSYGDPQTRDDVEFTSPKRVPPDTRNVSFWTIGKPHQLLSPSELETPHVEGALGSAFNPALLKLPPGSDWTVAVVARGPRQVLKDVFVEASKRYAQVETLLA
jgi:hypothetical protein